MIVRLESLLAGQVLRVKVKKVDLVNDTTSVDVRFRVPVGDPDRPLTLVDPATHAAFRDDVRRVGALVSELDR